MNISLYHHNRALLAYDTSLCKKDKEAEQYHSTVPEYQAPDISYKKKSVDVSKTSSKRSRKCRNTSTKQDNDRNVTVDDLLSLSFSLSEAVDFMGTKVKHSTHHLHNQCVNNLCTFQFH